MALYVYGICVHVNRMAGTQCCGRVKLKADKIDKIEQKFYLPNFINEPHIVYVHNVCDDSDAVCVQDTMLISIQIIQYFLLFIGSLFAIHWPTRLFLQLFDQNCVGHVSHVEHRRVYFSRDFLVLCLNSNALSLLLLPPNSPPSKQHTTKKFQNCTIEL